MLAAFNSRVTSCRQGSGKLDDLSRHQLKRAFRAVTTGWLGTRRKMARNPMNINAAGYFPIAAPKAAPTAAPIRPTSARTTTGLKAFQRETSSNAAKQLKTTTTNRTCSLHQPFCCWLRVITLNLSRCYTASDCNVDQSHCHKVHFQDKLEYRRSNHCSDAADSGT